MIFWVAYSHLIPISLYVALEILKIILAYLIGQDLEIYYEKEDKPTLCRTSDLVEEIGQVEFVFSDKTGTLTSNEMKFRQCSINDVIYSYEEDTDI
jgi:phospholipid-transporting ATPase|mmetsp:Transcript_9540/g.1425  ORF Transcript_9540/g.1425 Transcript_9540/m.1425 type:complete len:96 (+) Transcript_9540:376-663(+)